MLAAALALALAGATAARAADVADLALRGTLRPATEVRYGDVWGAGEYLLLTTYQPAESDRNGLYIVDASNPDSLSLAAFLPTTLSLRDVTAVDTLCLLSFESGRSAAEPAVMLVSIADPHAPRPLGTFRSDSVDIAHNAWLAPPYAYLASSRTGDLRIVDFTDPAAPREVGRWDTETQGHYLHDVLVRDSLAYLSYWEDGLVVLSVADPANPYEIGRFSYPLARAHSVALSRDGKTAYVADEIFTPPYGGLHVLDLSDPSEILEIGYWTCPDADNTIHNIVTRGDRLFVAYYTCGIRVLDIASPHSPREIAYHDVDPPGAPSAGFWGVYAVSDSSDIVYASHIEYGAFVMEQRTFRALHVEPGAAARYQTIADAMAAAGAGDTVRVAPGTYRENITLRASVSLEGSGAASTLIDGGDAGRALTIASGDATTRARGLTLIGGAAPAGEGGGAMLLVATQAVVESLIVTGSRADGDGGGALVVGGGPEFRAVRFGSNRARRGGAVAIVPGAATESTPRFVECEFFDNEAVEKGGAVFSSSLRPVSFVRSLLARNRARSGGAIAGDVAYIDLTNCVAAWNRAADAGGAFASAASYFRARHSVLASNSAPVGGAVAGSGSVSLAAEFSMTVVSGNLGATTFDANGLADVVYSGCNFFGNAGALTGGSFPAPDSSGGNVFLDPRFVDPSRDALDFLPALGSPLVDAAPATGAERDRDSTDLDIGIGGGAESGWVAPRLPADLRAVPYDNFDVGIEWGAARGERTRVEVFRDRASDVPIDAAHRVGSFTAYGFGEGLNRMYLGLTDTTLAPGDTAAYYRAVAVDDAGHAGGASGSIAATPGNRPPDISLWLDARQSSADTIDSLEVRFRVFDETDSATLHVNGVAIPARIDSDSRGRVSGRALLPIVAGPVTAIVRGVDIFGAAAAESLSGEPIHLAGDSRAATFTADGALGLARPAGGPELLVFVGDAGAPALPNGIEALSRAFTLEVLSYPFPDSLDIFIAGPIEMQPNEAFAALGAIPEVVAVRRDLGSRSRVARLPRSTLYRLIDGVVLGARGAPAGAPPGLRVFAPHPNPFRDATRLDFELDVEHRFVDFGIFDVTGRRVRRLIVAALPAGRYSIEWDGRDDGGSAVAAGHYFLRAETGAAASTRRMTLVR